MQAYSPEPCSIQVPPGHDQSFNFPDKMSDIVFPEARNVILCGQLEGLNDKLKAMHIQEAAERDINGVERGRVFEWGIDHKKRAAPATENGPLMCDVPIKGASAGHDARLSCPSD